MAEITAETNTGSVEIEDDEAWLYGDAEDDKEEDKNDETNPLEDIDTALSSDVLPGSKEKSGEDKEAGELSGEEENKDDDDDSDDDVQVTIGDIKTGPLEAPRNLFKSGTAYQRPGVPAVGGAGKKASDSKGVDVDAVGSINGVPIYDFDLNTLEEKPWNKPGADLTDYFNYGFNESSWVAYCEKERRIRSENNPTTVKTQNTIPVQDNSNPNLVTVLGGGGRKAGPPPGRKVGGAIDVIGSSAKDSRRPNSQDFTIKTITTTGDRSDYNKKPYGHQPPPPPGVTGDYGPPTSGPPPPGVPPPGVHVSSGIPTSYPSSYDPYYQAGPPGMVPPPGDRGPVPSPYDYYGHAPSYNFSGPPPSGPWERSPPRDSSDWPEGRRSPEWSSSDSESRYRRDYDRDFYRPERSRSRERDRDTRDRERDTRERRHAREERHKKRKSEADSSDHHRKHKKSKRSKREKDEAPEGGPPAEPSGEGKGSS